MASTPSWQGYRPQELVDFIAPYVAEGCKFLNPTYFVRRDDLGKNESADAKMAMDMFLQVILTI